MKYNMKTVDPCYKCKKDNSIQPKYVISGSPIGEPNKFVWCENCVEKEHDILFIRIEHYLNEHDRVELHKNYGVFKYNDCVLWYDYKTGQITNCWMNNGVTYVPISYIASLENKCFNVTEIMKSLCNLYKTSFFCSE